MQRLNDLRRGIHNWNADSAEAIYACTGCRHCSTYCEHKNEPALVLFAGRAEANRRGATHPRLENYPDRFRNRDHRLTTTLRERPYARVTGGAIGYMPGCDAVEKGQKDLDATLAVFERLSGQPVPLCDVGQTCAGYPLIASGYSDMFRWHASRVAADLKGFRSVVINCSACVFTLRSLYPAEGIHLATEVLAVPEYLLRLAQALPAIPGGKPIIYYHDPCHHVRYAGVVSQPRQILAKIADVREFAWAKEDADCCGGGGLLPKTMPHIADSMARRRLREIANRGGGTVVTSCATCTFMLRSNAPEGVFVYDLPAYIFDRLQP